MRIILLLFLLTNIYAANTSLDMGDVVSEIRRLIRDPSTDTDEQHWTDTEIHRRIEIAQDYIIRKTACLEAEATITTLQDTGEYRVASDCLEVRRVEFTIDVDSNSYSLIYMPKRKLDMMDIDWRQDSGKPKYWYDVKFSTGMIGIYPRISSTYANDTLTYNYIQKSSTETYTGYIASTRIFKDRVELQPYYQLIVYYVSRLFLLDMNEFDNADRFKKMFDEELALMIIEFNTPTIERTLRRPEK